MESRDTQSLETTPLIEVDEPTGLPLVRMGRPVTNEEVAAFLDEDA